MRSIVMATLVCFGAATASADEAPSIDGFWRSDGYGFVLEIAGEFARLYSTGDGMCLPETEEMVPISDLLPDVEFETRVDGQRLNIGSALEPHRISALRLPALPSNCLQKETVAPASVFDTLVAYFDANYPFFALHNVDWRSRVEAARRRINPTMDDQALFDVIDWLISPIRDAHVSVVAEIDGRVLKSAPGRARVLKHLRRSALADEADPNFATRAFRHSVWFESIRNDILRGHGHMAGNDRVQYGMLTDRIGYMAFATLVGLGGQDMTAADDLAATQILLDDIISFFGTHGATTIVLDLSLNFGGSDHIAREVASRFVHETRHIYTKFAADTEDPIKTDVYLDPHPHHRFDGDVLLLTSNVTVSAAEVLTLALRGQPHVTHLGETTRGALSDAFARSLPNGWQLSLSNEVYLDADGTHWEAVGIPPEIELSVFPDASSVESHRQSIQRLVQRGS